MVPTIIKEANAMEEKKVTVNELISQVNHAMKEGGYSIRTVYQMYNPVFGVIAKYFRKTGRIFYDPDVTEELIQLQIERKERGEITDGYLRTIRCAVHRLNEYFLTEEVRIINVVHGTKYILNEANARLIDLFVAWKGYGSNTSDDVVWVVRRYLYYFEQKGHDSMSTVTIEEVRQYILSTAAELKPSSLHNILLYLKHFHIFLKEEEIPAPDCIKLFSYKVYREMPIQSYVTDEELDAVLAQIDTSTPKGKRDLAIILLAATTGMRACDIIHLPP